MSFLIQGTPQGVNYTQRQLMTTSGTFTVPAGVTKLRVTRVGGGAGGGIQNSTQPFQLVAGGNGYCLTTEEAATAGASLTVAIGAGGATGASGGNTTITGMVAASGGYTGVFYSSVAGSYADGAGGTGWGIYGLGGTGNASGQSGAVLFEW